MFAQDRDLVVLEPGLLRDVAWTGQRTLSGTGSKSGSTLTLTDGSFDGTGIEGGHVILIGSLVHEVIGVDDSTHATVSLIRSDTSSNVVSGEDVTGASVESFTFEPQIELVHRQVLVMIGMDPDDAQSEGVVTNPNALTTLEALGALHLIYASAGAPGRGGEAYTQRADRYQKLFADERGRVSAMIDLDGDGIAETRRRPNMFVLSRG